MIRRWKFYAESLDGEGGFYLDEDNLFFISTDREAEFVKGFEVMPDAYPEVSIFGSSKIKPKSPIYKDTVKVSRLLVESGFNVISGGGPGQRFTNRERGKPMAISEEQRKLIDLAAYRKKKFTYDLVYEI